MHIYRNLMNHLARVLFVLTAILICTMVLIIFWQVFGRFVFNKTPRWSEELTLVLMIYTGFLGASLAYREKLHIGIMIFLQKMKPEVRNIINFLIEILVGLFSLFMLIWGSGFAWMMRNQTLPATKLPVGYSYLPIPLTGFILMLFVIEKIAGDIEAIRTGRNDSPMQIPGMEV